MQMKTILCCLLLLSVPASMIKAQEERESKISVDLSADIVSRYVWRGINLSTSPAVQPSLSLNAGNLSFGTWASYSFSPELFQEVDLFLNYDTRYISFTLNDYYNPVDSLGSFGDYFNLGNTTRHSLEGMITLNGPESFPLSLSTAVMIGGNDKDESGNNLYSTYIELNYSASLRETELTPFIGLTPAAGYYGDQFGIVNVGIQAIRNIEVSEKFKIPLTARFIINPQLEKVYFVIGITL
jgi:hypothetical protein